MDLQALSDATGLARRPAVVLVTALRAMRLLDADAEGRLTDEDTRMRLRRMIEALAAWLGLYGFLETLAEPMARYPLAFLSPPARHFLNSSFANLPRFREFEREPQTAVYSGSFPQFNMDLSGIRKQSTYGVKVDFQFTPQTRLSSRVNGSNQFVPLRGSSARTCCQRQRPNTNRS